MAGMNLKWIKERSQKVLPVTFGVPWARGTMSRDTALAMVGEDGKAIASQVKPIGFWPDGSVKWTAHSAVADTTQNYTIQPGESPAPCTSLKAVETENGVCVSGELISCYIEKGDMLLSGLKRKGSAPVNGKLVSLIENREINDEFEQEIIRRFEGVTEKVTLEETGPVRVVVKVDGVHQEVGGERRVFPFSLRFYFFADSDEVKLIHTFIYDGDEAVDFLKGIAVELQREGAGKGTISYVTENEVVDVEGAQVRLSQESCDYYAILKNDAVVQEGNRSQGTMLVSDDAGVLGVSVKDCWQKSPMALEVQESVLTVWLWSRYAESMDFRAYDTISHTYSYGGILNHPEGIANTNEIYLKFYEAVPAKEELMDFAADVQSETLMIAEDMNVYADTKVFGSFWYTKEDQYKSQRYEKAIYNIQKFYMGEVKQRRWYGFWDYGDVMHTYDPVRHCWRYDVGGFAWQNTEMCNTYANWFCFLRTGDYEVYRFAKAMSRHCSEIDVYHKGKYAMLGSRHNVRHWGCGAKEARISMAGHYRYYYFLTADERIGDIMDEVKDSDYITLEKDPMAIYFDPHPRFSHCRTGPDWSSFVSNWMTHWERTEDPKYRDKLLNGVESIKKAPLGLSSGTTFHYEPETGMMYYMGADNPAGHIHPGDGNYPHFMAIFMGAAEIWFELAELLQDDGFDKMLSDMGEYYGMTLEERIEKSEGRYNAENDVNWSGSNCRRMTAFSGYYLDRERYIASGWDGLTDKDSRLSQSTVVDVVIDDDGNMIRYDVEPKDAPYPLREVVGMNTNTSAQWSLNYIEVSHWSEEYGKKK